MIYRNGQDAGHQGPSTTESVDFKNHLTRRNIQIAVGVAIGLLFLVFVWGAVTNSNEEEASSGGFDSSQNETFFWVQANERGDWDSAGRGAAESYGYKVCALLEDNSMNTVASYIVYQDTTPVSRSGKVLGVEGAVTWLCPEYQQEYLNWKN